MKLARLRGRKNCDRVQHKGNLWKGKHFLVRWLPGAPYHPAVDRSHPGVYLGTLGSSKLHKSAVKRNRMRRRCREAWRIVLLKIKEVSSVQLLVIPRSSSLEAPFAELQQDASRFLSLHGAKEI